MNAEVKATLFVLGSLVVALYTGVYALEVWRSGNRFGGVGLFVLTALTAVLPALVFLVL